MKDTAVSSFSVMAMTVRAGPGRPADAHVRTRAVQMSRPGATDAPCGRPRRGPDTPQEPHAHRRSQGPRRRTPLRTDHLDRQGRAALPPGHRRRDPRHRPGRAALHPGVPAARAAELRHRGGRRRARGDRRAVHAGRRRRPGQGPARRADPAPAPAHPGDRRRHRHLPHRRRVRQGQGRRPRPAHRRGRRTGGAVDERRPDLRAGGGRLGRRAGPLGPHPGAGRPAGPGGRATRPPGPGPALPPVRRRQPAARRPRVRRARRVRPAHPARAVHLRHDAQGRGRHPARRRRGPGAVVRRPVRRRGLPRRDAAHPHVARGGGPGPGRRGRRRAGRRARARRHRRGALLTPGRCPSSRRADRTERGGTGRCPLFPVRCPAQAAASVFSAAGLRCRPWGAVSLSLAATSPRCRPWPAFSAESADSCFVVLVSLIGRIHPVNIIFRTAGRV
ncbi:hypothetical protein SGPA1_30970 [Streptomyces misionensis JCM 4497]